MGMIISYQVGVAELKGEFNLYHSTLGNIDLNESSIHSGVTMVIGIALTCWWKNSYQKWYDIQKRD